jgi:hypothetical protein
MSDPVDNPLKFLFSSYCLISIFNSVKIGFNVNQV